MKKQYRILLLIATLAVCLMLAGCPTTVKPPSFPPTAPAAPAPACGNPDATGIKAAKYCLQWSTNPEVCKANCQAMCEVAAAACVNKGWGAGDTGACTRACETTASNTVPNTVPNTCSSSSSSYACETTVPNTVLNPPGAPGTRPWIGIFNGGSAFSDIDEYCRDARVFGTLDQIDLRSYGGPLYVFTSGDAYCAARNNQVHTGNIGSTSGGQIVLK